MSFAQVITITVRRERCRGLQTCKAGYSDRDDTLTKHEPNSGVSVLPSRFRLYEGPPGS